LLDLLLQDKEMDLESVYAVVELKRTQARGLPINLETLLLLVMLSWEMLIRPLPQRLVFGTGFSVAKRVKRYCQMSFRITIGVISKEQDFPSAPR
jgi:hypothetical protein